MGLVSTTVGVLCNWDVESAELFLRGNRKLLTKNGLISQRRKRRVRDTTGEFVGLGRLQRDLDKHDLWRVDTLPFPGILFQKWLRDLCLTCLTTIAHEKDTQTSQS